MSAMSPEEIVALARVHPLYAGRDLSAASFEGGKEARF